MPDERVAPEPSRDASRWWPAIAALLATTPVAVVAMRRVVHTVGHAAVPLDDAYIHFQYARRLAEGHFFSYTDGARYTSGATSVLWPMALAPFWKLGLRDTLIVWPAWILCWLAAAGLVLETFRLAERLAGRGPAVAAGAMVLAFGGHAWCATSGMEVLPLAWLLARSARRAAEWVEAAPRGRTGARRWELLALATAAPLMRPEGSLASLTIAAALAAYAPSRRARLVSLAALVGPALPPLLNLAFTGSLATSTTMVKWLPVNPYYRDAGALVPAVRENLRVLFDVIFEGRQWGAEFFPAGSRPAAIAALVALPLVGFRSGTRFRALAVLAVALGLLATTTYLSFLWNRLRYLWPFAFAWCVGLACVARAAGELAGAVRASWGRVSTVVAGAFAGLLAGQLDFSIGDVAESAHAIDLQQVTIGRWAREHLPADALVGVSDTGAIAYFSGRRTFDVVGLTTPGEAPYWVAGAGSRYEHYERVHARDPRVLPTHFIVYPQWMSCDPVLGEELHRETVEHSILGGTDMVAYVADWSTMGRADRPEAPPAGTLVDELDVADLDSEQAHGYVVGPARDTDDVVGERETDDGATLADGFRQGRREDAWDAALVPGQEHALVMRLRADADTKVVVTVDDAPVGERSLAATDWSEVAVPIPARVARARVRVRVAASAGTFGVGRYWLYAR